MTTFFEKGEVVWGKIKGYPYWPAMITDFNNNLIYTIKFYNDNTYAKLSSKFLLKYEVNKNKIIESNRKNKKLLSAVKSADMELKKINSINKLYQENSNNLYETNIKENNKIKIDTEKIQIKKSDSNQNLEPKNFEIKNNNDKINKLSNKLEIMSGQNNRVNIFSIIKNTKNIININNPNSIIVPPTILEENNIFNEKNDSNLETNNNNNDIIIPKNILYLNKNDEMDLLLSKNKNIDNIIKENEKEKKFKRLKKLKKGKRKEKSQEKENKINQKNYFIKIEIENLELKNHKKKEIKIKPKIDEKAKEEKKKREEEDNFIYQIDEYFYKIFELYNTKKYEKLEYEKEHFKKVLLYLSKYKRTNFIEFLKMTNISKYIQYFTCYLKSYDSDLNNLVQKVYINFHRQFNKEFYNNGNREN